MPINGAVEHKIYREVAKRIGGTLFETLGGDARDSIHGEAAPPFVASAVAGDEPGAGNASGSWRGVKIPLPLLTKDGISGKRKQTYSGIFADERGFHKSARRGGYKR